MATRRTLLKLGCVGAAGLIHHSASAAEDCRDSDDEFQELKTRVRAARLRPVSKLHSLTEPIIIDRVEMLRRDGQYLVRAVCTEGVTGWALANPSRMDSAFGIFANRVAPFFSGKDARNLETLLDEVFIAGSNYKWQGLALWICVARAELAILDLIGRRTGQPAHALLGGKLRDYVGLYHANGDRDHSAEWVLERLKESVAESGARAVKFKLGARMHYTDASTARDHKLIPMVRKHFGDDMVIYADANSSYDVKTAIKIGRVLEDYEYGFFEEPVQFDYLQETKEVADSISIPVAGGEQESSLWRFEWLIANRALRIVQPDLIYFGGLVRSLRVAARAREAGIDTVPHISGSGLGSLYMAHFASVVPNTTDYQEYKGDPDKVPYEVTGIGGRFKAVDGRLEVPTTPGFGITFDPDFLSGLEPLPA
jgi:L-alanine-DL-glutamate epimerase-like enolase superfamily enzyme